MGTCRFEKSTLVNQLALVLTMATTGRCQAVGQNIEIPCFGVSNADVARIKQLNQIHNQCSTVYNRRLGYQCWTFGRLKQTLPHEPG